MCMKRRVLLVSSYEGQALEATAFLSPYILIFQAPVFIPHRCSTTVSLETFYINANFSINCPRIYKVTQRKNL